MPISILPVDFSSTETKFLPEELILSQEAQNLTLETAILAKQVGSGNFEDFNEKKFQDLGKDSIRFNLNPKYPSSVKQIFYSSISIALRAKPEHSGSFVHGEFLAFEEALKENSRPIEEVQKLFPLFENGTLLFQYAPLSFLQQLEEVTAFEESGSYMCITLIEKLCPEQTQSEGLLSKQGINNISKKFKDYLEQRGNLSDSEDHQLIKKFYNIIANNPKFYENAPKPFQRALESSLFCSCDARILLMDLFKELQKKHEKALKAETIDLFF